MESKQEINAVEPRINVYFVVVGEEYSKEYLSKKLNLVPSRFRTKDDWPETIKNWPVHNPNLPDEYKPRTVWEISTGYDECWAVKLQLKKLLQKLEGKEVVINQLRKELNLSTHIQVSIETTGNFPEVYLDPESIEFLVKIDASICFGFFWPT